MSIENDLQIIFVFYFKRGRDLRRDRQILFCVLVIILISYHNFVILQTNDYWKTLLKTSYKIFNNWEYICLYKAKALWVV